MMSPGSDVIQGRESQFVTLIFGIATCISLE